MRLIQVLKRSHSVHRGLFSPLHTKETDNMKLKQWLVVSTLCLTAWSAQAEVNQIRVWAAACANCHGTMGKAEPGNESLAGKDKDELVQKLLDFKTGRKPATLMHQIAKGYTDEQLTQLAAYFASLKK
jgi:cytochrome subunit of sulfide dehydrogenase